jgi:hypothetical protein
VSEPVSSQTDSQPAQASAALRVLHLVDPAAAEVGACALRLLGDLVASGDASSAAALVHDVLVIGRSREVNLATECGVDALGSIWPRHGRTLNAAGALGRWMLAARRAGTAPDVLHAWSGGCGALAALAAPAMPRVVTPVAAAVDVDSPHLVAREMVRARWKREEGVGADEFVIGLLGEHVECFDARNAMHVGARTGLSSRRVRLVMSGRSLGRANAQRFLAALDLDHAIIHDEAVARPWSVLGGLDAALLLPPTILPSGRGAGGRRSELSVMPLLWSWAAGVPVVADALAPTHGLVEDGRTGLLFPASDLNAGCDRVARLYDDAALAQRLANAGRETVAQRFSTSIFRARVHNAYRQAWSERRAWHLEAGTAA